MVSLLALILRATCRSCWAPLGTFSTQSVCGIHSGQCAPCKICICIRSSWETRAISLEWKLEKLPWRRQLLPCHRAGMLLAASAPLLGLWDMQSVLGGKPPRLGLQELQEFLSGGPKRPRDFVRKRTQDFIIIITMIST